MRSEGLLQLAMTTNGVALKRRLPELVDGGLDAVNISLDTLREDRFREIARRSGFAQVRASLDAAVDAARRGWLRTKVNAVIMRGVNDDEIPDFVALARDHPIEVRFIEFMPFDGNEWDDARLMPYEEMVQAVRRVHPDLYRTDDGPNPTSKVWTAPGFAGSVGYISSMTSQFCGSCNRLRLTADGKVKTCLFGSDEVSLRDAMRSGACDEELLEVVRGALARKHAALGGYADAHDIAQHSDENRAMVRIGG